MSRSVTISLPRQVAIKPVAWIIAGYGLIAVIALRGYLDFHSLNCLLGTGAFLFLWQFRQQGASSSRLGWLVLVCMLVTACVPVKTCLYFTLSFALLFAIEYFLGRTGWLPLLVIVLISPVFRYLSDTFSFPIRLELTKWAGAFFNAAGVSTTVKGNVILHGTNEFSVDPGCMGLSMMETSLLLGVLLIAFMQHTYKRRLRSLSLLLYFTLIVLLNIVANLFRIILLVHFTVLPGTISHELTGIACLLVYVFIPAVFLATFFVKRAPVSVATDPVAVSRKGIFLHVALLACAAALAIYVLRTDTYKEIDLSSIKQTEGLAASLHTPGIVKLQDSRSLIYIKYIRGFYDTDHSPMTCWKGSGYVVEQVQQETIGGAAVYTGLLVNGNDRLYSAWWYSNGANVTISQLTWRWNMVKTRDRYAVINITCASREDLVQRAEAIIGKKILSPFFDNSIFH